SGRAPAGRASACRRRRCRGWCRRSPCATRGRAPTWPDSRCARNSRRRDREPWLRRTDAGATFYDLRAARRAVTAILIDFVADATKIRGAAACSRCAGDQRPRGQQNRVEESSPACESATIRVRRKARNSRKRPWEAARLARSVVIESILERELCCAAQYVNVGIPRQDILYLVYQIRSDAPAMLFYSLGLTATVIASE